tara:strand:- start:453 stop:572 length:120 start_codon:yes stop_codon:yes gene_type:complete
MSAAAKGKKNSSAYGSTGDIAVCSSGIKKKEVLPALSLL